MNQLKIRNTKKEYGAGLQKLIITWRSWSVGVGIALTITVLGRAVPTPTDQSLHLIITVLGSHGKPTQPTQPTHKLDEILLPFSLPRYITVEILPD